MVYFLFLNHFALPIPFYTVPDIFGPPEQAAVVSLIFRLLTSALGGRSIDKVTANGCHFGA